jgi:hypothetical protein
MSSKPSCIFEVKTIPFVHKIMQYNRDSKYVWRKLSRHIQGSVEKIHLIMYNLFHSHQIALFWNVIPFPDVLFLKTLFWKMDESEFLPYASVSMDMKL